MTADLIEFPFWKIGPKKIVLNTQVIKFETTVTVDPLWLACGTFWLRVWGIA